MHPDDVNDRAYRELRILLQLAHLQLDHRCFNFVHLREWVKSSPPLMFDDSIVDPNAQFMYFELEYADSGLPAMRQLSLRDYKMILFQILYALHVAQTQYKFVHNDLHAKNILIQTPQSCTPQLVFHDKEKVWYCSKFLVKITDFGLSRLQLAGTSEVIYNTNNKFTELFSPTEDLAQLHGVFKSIKIIDWSDSVDGGDEDCVSSERENQARNSLRLFRAKWSKSTNPGVLLHDPFFHSLTIRPTSVDARRCLLASSSGHLTLLRRIVEGVEDCELQLMETANRISSSEQMISELTRTSHLQSKRLAREHHELFKYYKKMSNRGVRVNYSIDTKAKEKKKRKKKSSRMFVPNSPFKGQQDLLHDKPTATSRNVTTNSLSSNELYEDYRDQLMKRDPLSSEQYEREDAFDLSECENEVDIESNIDQSNFSSSPSSQIFSDNPLYDDLIEGTINNLNQDTPNSSHVAAPDPLKSISSVIGNAGFGSQTVSQLKSPTTPALLHPAMTFCSSNVQGEKRGFAISSRVPSFKGPEAQEQIFPHFTAISPRGRTRSERREETNISSFRAVSQLIRNLDSSTTDPLEALKSIPPPARRRAAVASEARRRLEEDQSKSIPMPINVSGFSDDDISLGRHEDDDELDIEV